MSNSTVIYTALVGGMSSTPMLYGSAATVVLVSLVAMFIWPAAAQDKNKIYELRGWTPLASLPFFTKRFDFIWSNFKASGFQAYQFRVIGYKVVAMRGEESRRLFFNDKSLGFTEGYELLTGGGPHVNDADPTFVQDENGWLTNFNKRLLMILRKDRLQKMLPALLNDIRLDMETWGNQGKINPFDNICRLVFHMTVRMTTCNSLADQHDLVRHIHNLYWKIEKSNSPIALLFPWLPIKARRDKKQATADLLVILDKYLTERREAAVPSADAFDLLIADGSDNQSIIETTISAIFAGVINTGMNVCWALVFISAHPDWKQKVYDEVQTLIAKHTDPKSSVSLYKRLASIPISGWEEEMPVVEAVIRETLRLVMTSNTALRRNMSRPISFSDGKVIDLGAIMLYNFRDVHMDPEIYESPEKFDPLRFNAGREEDRKTTFGFLGWGAGKHPCTGMKVAKLEIKLIVAFVVAAYEFTLVDEKDNFPSPFPKPDQNDYHQARPLGDPCYFKFKRVVE